MPRLIMLQVYWPIEMFNAAESRCKGENCYLRFSTARPGVKSVKPHGRHHFLSHTLLPLLYAQLCLQNLDVWFKVRVLRSRKMLCSRLGAVQRLLAPELKGGDAAAEKQERQASIQFRFCKIKGWRLSIASDDITHIIIWGTRVG